MSVSVPDTLNLKFKKGLMFMDAEDQTQLDKELSI
jgi:hypothetical protein